MIAESFGVKFSDSDTVKSYIKEVINRFHEKSTDTKFSPIIHPPLLRKASSRLHVFMPKVLLWTSQKHFVVPVHKSLCIPFMRKISVSGKENFSEDIQGNVILVQRIYH